MARLPRLTVPGYAHHVIWRGNNRQPLFVDRQDFECMLGLLATHASQHKVALHAYVLMDNHVHWLLTPESVQGLPLMMQAIGRRYVRYFNDKHGRTGTLFEGRYKSTLIQSERYLLACMVYIDLNPVRAHLVEQAADYAWSSHAHCIGRRLDKFITPHPLYWALGNTPFAREAAYADLVKAGNASGIQGQLTQATLHAWALGDPTFVANLQKMTERRVVRQSPGRPGRQSSTR
jgi:putative transposase